MIPFFLRKLYVNLFRNRQHALLLASMRPGIDHIHADSDNRICVHYRTRIGCGTHLFRSWRGVRMFLEKNHEWLD